MYDKLAYSVVDNRLTIESIRTNFIEGNVTLTGNLNVDSLLNVRDDVNLDQNLFIKKDLNVSGNIKASTIYADNVITTVKIEQKEPLYFTAERDGLENKGIIFKHNDRDSDVFVYRKDPKRIFSTLDIDLYKDNSFLIDGTSVLNVDTLGPSVTKSSLRKVGRLRDLIVDGNTNIGEYVFFDAGTQRFGIGIDKPNSAFSLVDNGIEFAMGNLYANDGNFGTFTSHDFGIITDNICRMRFSKTGKITFGDEQAYNADVSIFGKLYVKELIVDQKSERSSPLEFKALKDNTNYGRGMVFTGHGINKQFILAGNPDQFFSTENINLQANRGYYIDNELLLTKTELGNTVVKSKLTELGTLKNLNVSGDINLNNAILINDKKISIGDTVIDSVDGLRLTSPSIEFKSENQSIKINKENIIFGNKDRPVANVTINGNLSIGIQTVGNNAQLDIAGNIRFADKLFMVGIQPPTTGTYSKGDIVWNNDPKETGYVGWVCIRDGNPGIWRGFGQIGIE